MSSKFKLLAAVVLVVVVALFVHKNSTSVPATDTVSQDLARLSASEVEKQARMAMSELLAAEQEAAIQQAATKLRELASAPARKGIAAGELVAQIGTVEQKWVQLQQQWQQLKQQKEQQLSQLQQGDLAIEMLVAPQASNDAYLDGLFKQYKGYSETLQLVLKALFAEQKLAAQQAAYVRLQGMAPTALDNVRVLGLEIPALAASQQVKNGTAALQQLLQKEGTVAHWIAMTTQQQELVNQSEALLSQFKARN
ncbi:MAG: hypothetical protein ACRCRW_01805 [Aeromonadaceae bacterium]